MVSNFQIVFFINHKDYPYLGNFSAGKLGAPRVAKNGFSLPSARKVSMTCAEMDKNKSKQNGEDHTVMVMQMGQYIDHDITHSPIFNKDNCCKNNRVPGMYNQFKHNQ